MPLLICRKLNCQRLTNLSWTRYACICTGIEVTGIDAMYPETEEEYNKFEEALKTKISFFEVSNSLVNTSRSVIS